MGRRSCYLGATIAIAVLVAWCGLSADEAASWSAVPAPKLTPESCLPRFSGEGCLAAAWSRDCDQAVSWRAVYQQSTTPTDRGAGGTLLELAQTARRLGWSAELRKDDDAEAGRELHADLVRGRLSLIKLRFGRTTRFVLAVGHVRDRFQFYDPAGTADLQQWPRQQFLEAWQAADLARQRLSVGGRATARPAAATAHDRAEYARRVAEIRLRPGVDKMHVVVEPPFIVVGDHSPEETRRWATGTVRWAVRRMRQAYFQDDPRRILEIWLFDGQRSYETNTKALFGDSPHTPYGYYSPRHGALIMNIRTGGGTLVHEILHPFMESNFRDCPSWFNEGLASLYEQCGDHEGRIWGRTNWRLAGLQRAIAADGVPTFQTLCGTTRREFYDDRTGVHYAMARYLCYYLQEQGLLRKYYHAFRRDAEDDPTGYRTLQRILAEEDMEAFQAKWEKYVLNLRFPEQP